MTDEEKVRAVWIEVNNFGGDAIEGSWCLAITNNEGMNFYHYHTESEAWSSVLAFTEQSLEEIRQLWEEIAEIADDLTCYAPGEETRKPYERILSRLESILAEKTVGIKPEALKERND